MRAVPRKENKLELLVNRLKRDFPGQDPPEALIKRGEVLVDGRVVMNPASRVPKSASVTLKIQKPLQGSLKLSAALDTFRIAVEGRICLDVGAAAGGFTSILLERGASHVYAVDVGFGQLLGSLRQNNRVTTLERTNISDLTRELIPDAIQIVTVDLSYVSLSKALPQLSNLRYQKKAIIICLVKPMFELGLPHPPREKEDAVKAVSISHDALERSGWIAKDSMESPIKGARGAIEYFIWAVRLAA